MCSEPSAESACAERRTSGQFALLRQRRFAPFFWTQFAGAANDNLLKLAFTLMVTYQLSVHWLTPQMAGLVIGALFIVPFLLFSATSGQLADKYEKATLIRLVKDLEIGIMVLAAWGFFTAHAALLLACVFLLGVHSSVFGPVKYAYLPQVLDERELTGGNGMVEMGTFVAILLGNVAAGLLMASPRAGHGAVAAACLAVALLGRLAAQWVPRVAATDPRLQINWNPLSETWRNLGLVRGQEVVFRSILGISWMWFFGAVFLANFPVFAKDVLRGNEQVATLLLVVFSIGVGAGSLLCERLSRRHVEIGLVPLGAIGMTVFAVDLYFAARALAPAPVMGVADFLAHAAHWRVLIDLLLLSLSAGLYSVPMYALIQWRTPATHRARVIAANNILNALFMIASSVIVGLLLKGGVDIVQIFWLLGVANALVSFYIFLREPEYLLRCIAWVASRLVYRWRVRGDAHIPAAGPALLVTNHGGCAAALLLLAASPRPIRCIIDRRVFQAPLLGWVLRLARCIPIAPQGTDPAVYERALTAAVQALRAGDVLGIFPAVAQDHGGHRQFFDDVVMAILRQAQADGVAPPVVPAALTNPRRAHWGRVGLHFGAALASHEVTPERLHERMAQLLI